MVEENSVDFSEVSILKYLIIIAIDLVLMLKRYISGSMHMRVKVE